MTAISVTPQVVSEIFQKQATENYTSSVTFMKQLTVVAISTVTYLKNVFPEDSYMLDSFGGLRLRILKNKCRDDLAQFLSQSLMLAFEAFDKRYLHQLALCFYEEEYKMENLIEYHIFEYSYHGDGVTMNVHSKSRDNVQNINKFTFENLKERTRHMLRSCVVLMESCQNELPSNYHVSLRLYYNGDAPSGYQAPGFQCPGELEDHLDASLAGSTRLGCVETPFHKLTARTYLKDTAAASHEAIASQNPPVITQGDVDQANAVSGPAGDTNLHCPCNMWDGGPSRDALLTCHYCGTQQHAACFGVRGVLAALVSRHCCALCHDAQRARRPTDDRLVALSARQRECLCIFRRTLEWCTQRSTVEAAVLIEEFQISELNAVKLMKLLKSHKVIELDENDFSTPQKINLDNLNIVVGKFFQAIGDQNIVDRLSAETLTSQESCSDPLSEVLSPLEKVSLQNASSLCRAADPADVPSGAVVTEDATLKQYREAILSTDKFEDLASVTEGLDKGVQGRSLKRKGDEARNKDEPGPRRGVRSKRARTGSK